MLSVEPHGYTEGPYILDAAIDTLHDLYTTHQIHGGFVWRSSAIRERLLDGKRMAIAWFGLDRKGACQTAYLRRVVTSQPQRVTSQPQ